MTSLKSKIINVVKRSIYKNNKILYWTLYVHCTYCVDLFVINIIYLTRINKRSLNCIPQYVLYSSLSELYGIN